MTSPSETVGMARLAWGDPARPVDLVFAHANGFNARTYRGLLEPLGERRRILAPDLRGHGATVLPADPHGRSSWMIFARDLIGLLRSLDGPPVVLAGHSMGATAALMAAAEAPERIRSLVLLDPVILDRRAAAVMRVPGLWRLARRHPWVAASLKRRRRFADREAAFRAYLGRGAFKDWPDETLRDYVEAGFRPTADGDVELACAPEWEAANYAAQANDPWGALKRVGRPVHILKGGRNSTCAVTPADAAGLANVTVEDVPGGTHFLPMVMPDAARAALRVALA